MTRGKKVYKTVVADSHNLFRRGLATLIAAEADMEVWGEAPAFDQALAFFQQPAAEVEGVATCYVLVMDIAMLSDNAEAVKAVHDLSKSVSVLFLAPEESPECLSTTEAAGARGYMLKSSTPAQFMAGIRKAASLEDRDALSRQAPDLRALAEKENAYSRTSPLTSREQEVVTLLAEGRTVREVAAELALSIKTIEAHKLNLMRKLDIHNRASLVDYAVRSGLVSLQPVEKH